jgi:DNA-binding response OmpR family regulator
MPWILVADDNSDLRALMAEALSERGYHVETASDGADVVQMLDTAAEMPTAVVLDVMMPRVSGLDVLRAMRSLGRTKGVPAIILSGAPVDDAKLAGLDVSAVFLKPVAASALSEAIDRACGRSRRSSSLL